MTDVLFITTMILIFNIIVISYYQRCLWAYKSRIC